MTDEMTDFPTLQERPVYSPDPCPSCGHGRLRSLCKPRAEQPIELCESCGRAFFYTSAFDTRDSDGRIRTEALFARWKHCGRRQAAAAEGRECPFCRSRLERIPLLEADFLAFLSLYLCRSCKCVFVHGDEYVRRPQAAKKTLFGTRWKRCSVPESAAAAFGVCPDCGEESLRDISDRPTMLPLTHLRCKRCGCEYRPRIISWRWAPITLSLR